ncbi:hypothetical protein J8815_27310, partial [Klebsiella pneumoniae]
CGWLTCVVIHLKNKKSNKNLKIGIAVKYRFIKLVIPFIAQSFHLMLFHCFYFPKKKKKKKT